MYKLFTLRVRSADIYLSWGVVLILNVKNGEDLQKLNSEKYHGPVPSLLCCERSSHDKMTGIL